MAELLEAPKIKAEAPFSTRVLTKRILMLVENHYPQDTRVRNEATLLASAGCRVLVICLKKHGQPAFEEINGVRVYRIPSLELFKKTPLANPTALQRIALKLKALIGYLAEYGYFTSACLGLSSYLCVRRGFDVIHAHNPPDTLVFVALPFKVLGKRFVFDHHDLCPELYRSRYGAAEGITTRVLTFLEWCSLKAANITIATNESYKEIQVARAGKNPDTVFIVRNGPNERRMHVAEPNPRLKKLGKCVLCYIGSLNPQDGVDYLLRALHHLARVMKRDDFHCVIMGAGDSLEDLRSLSRELQLEHLVELPGFVSEEELQSNLAAADICVDPDPSSPLNDVSTWIKIMEYMAYAKPIVSFDLKETRFSAESAAIFVPPNDEPQFAQAVARLIDDPQLREQMGQFGRARVEKHLQWSVVGQNLLNAYSSL